MNNNNKISQEQFEQIDRYVLNEMDHNEREAFESQLKKQPELKQLVEQHKTLIEAIEIEGLKNLMDKLHDQETNRVFPLNTNKKRPKTSFYNYAIAASLILLVSIFGVLLFDQNPNKKLYAKYFKPDPGLPTTMSETSNFEFYDAMVNYKQGDYEKAISKWEIIQEKNQHSDTINYFLGVAHLANENEDLAISYLKFVSDSDEKSFENETNYYLGLAYLKSDNVELAKKYLTFSKIDNSKDILNELAN